MVHRYSGARSTTPYSRYLLVKVTSENYSHTAESESKIPLVKFDPHFKVTVGRKAIGIPDPTYKLDVLLRARRAEVAAQVDEHDEDDASVFQHGITQPTQEGSRARPVVVSSDEDGDPDDYDESWAHEEDVPVAGPSMVRAVAPLATKDKGRPADDWTPDADWVWQTVEHLLMPPSESTPGATRSIQRELKAMLDEQKQAPSLRELGWYMPPAILENNDNLFQWIVGSCCASAESMGGY
jgi:ubiquitin-conjugating enzyme E2 Q